MSKLVGFPLSLQLGNTEIGFNTVEVTHIVCVTSGNVHLTQTKVW